VAAVEDFKSNPFPGMNPFLELQWSDVHTVLISYIRDALADELPEDLRSLVEEQLAITGTSDKSYRTDVAVVERWKEGLPPLWQPDAASGQAPIVAAEPEVVIVEPTPRRWVEIRDRQDDLVTVIEVVSPGNKTSFAGRNEYRAKQRDLLAAGVNLVEIDLVRRGEHVITAEKEVLRPAPAAETRYLICAVRGDWPNRRELYYCPLREALPTIRIPLRPSDPDVPLALQPLINRVYHTGRCWHLNHQTNPPGPDWSDEERQWLDERLRCVGLR
jgi:Protein of unknown function (DUF4058)